MEKLPMAASGNFPEWKIKAIEFLSRRTKHFSSLSIELVLTWLERPRRMTRKRVFFPFSFISLVI